MWTLLRLFWSSSGEAGERRSHGIITEMNVADVASYSAMRSQNASGENRSHSATVPPAVRPASTSA